jgi:hypothetical protein
VLDETVLEKAQERSSRWAAFQVVLVAVLLPSVAYLVTQPEPFYALTQADPLLYAGYTFAPADLIARLGYPYYAVRFGFIIPANVFTEVFGVAGGYFMLRWVVAGIAVAATFVCLRRRYTPAIGLIGCLILVCNPIFVRAILTHYTTVIVLPATAVVCALLAMGEVSRRGGLVLRGGVGLAMGVAFAANPFSAFPNAVAVAVYALVRGPRRWRNTLAELVVLSSMALLVLVAGAVLYWWRFGDPNILSPSLDAARRYSGETVPGVEPDLQWLQFRPDTWLAVLAGLALACSLYASRWANLGWQERAFLATPLAMWLAFALHQFVLDGYMLEIYFYNSQLLPPSALAIGAGIAVLARSGDRTPRPEIAPSPESSLRLLPWAAAGVLVLALFVVARYPIDLWTIPGVFLVGGVLAAAAAWPRQRDGGRWLLATAAACLPLLLALGSVIDVPLRPGQPFRQDARYREALFNSDSTWFNRYLLASRIVDRVPRTELDPGSVVFWYQDDDELATLMQWTYLWVYTKLQHPGDPAMPALSDRERTALLGRTPRFLFVLGSDPVEVQQGAAAIQSLDVGARAVRSETLREGSDTISIVLLELDADECDLEGEGEPLFWITRSLCSTD